MDNLAYKLRENRVFEEIEKIKHEVELPGERAKRKHKAMSKSAFMIIGYALMFLIAGVVYLNSIIIKTKYNIRMEELKKKAAALEIEVHKLKADTDAAVNLSKVEEYAKTNFGMEITEDIRYVKIK